MNIKICKYNNLEFLIFKRNENVYNVYSNNFYSIFNKFRTRCKVKKCFTIYKITKIFSEDYDVRGSVLLDFVCANFHDKPIIFDDMTMKKVDKVWIDLRYAGILLRGSTWLERHGFVPLYYDKEVDEMIQKINKYKTSDLKDELEKVSQNNISDNILVLRLLEALNQSEKNTFKKFIGELFDKDMDLYNNIISGIKSFTGNCPLITNINYVVGNYRIMTHPESEKKNIDIKKVVHSLFMYDNIDKI